MTFTNLVKDFCGLCNNHTAFVSVQIINDRRVEVMRCAVCDTAPCDGCGARTIDPAAPKCPDCKRDIRVKGKDS